MMDLDDALHAEAEHAADPRPPIAGGHYDVVILGAGVGGLAAGALLAQAGAKVALIEQHVVPGGYCHSWWRAVKHGASLRRFRFDAGAMDFSGVNTRGALVALLRRLNVADRIEWLPLEHTYRYGGLCIDVPHDCETYVNGLCAVFPECAAGIRGFFDAMRVVYESQYYFADQRSGIRRPARSDAERAAYARANPYAAEWEDRRVQELLQSFVSHRQAQAILMFLSYYLGDDRNAITVRRMADVYSYYFYGGFYPRGGTGKLADVLADAVRAHGGVIRLKTVARRILVDDRRACGVELANGARLTANHVVSNVDLKRTFSEFVEPHWLSSEFRAAIDSLSPACSGFCVYLGIDFTPNVRSYTVSSKDGFPNYAFHIPSIVDATAAPEGYAAFEIRTLLSNKGMRNWFPDEPVTELNAAKAWRRSLEYNARKRIFGDRLVKMVEEVVPDLRNHIVYRCDASPVTYARYSGASQGSVYGFNKLLGCLDRGFTPIENLYVVGSGAKGAGVEAAVISGADAAENIVPGILASDFNRAAIDASNVAARRASGSVL